ncbi:uncharacterized protein LOC117654071 [Thrips palmi]|uniref:Uncharacterized protein LOC117654071 n=1 Tax=Thrips palmi TaxID=161013 RepID=A0A6P9AKU8_THRPL|nr:uncharacterized protein LOC117654071 [Thrips palmi]
MDDTKKRKRSDEEELVVDTKQIPSKLLKSFQENASQELRTPKAETEKLSVQLETPNGTVCDLMSTPKGNTIKQLDSETSSESKSPSRSKGKELVSKTPNGTGFRLLRKSESPKKTESKVLKEWETPNGNKGKLQNVSKTPNGTGFRLLQKSKTPNETESKALKDWKTPNGIKGRLRGGSKTPNGTESNLLKELKTPSGAGAKLSETKTPKRHSAQRKGRLWCCDCDAEASGGCAGHTRLDLETARHRAADALRAAQSTLQRLDELVQKGAPRLRVTVTRRGGEGQGLEEDDVHQQDVEVALASSRLTENERRVLCAYLEGLVLERDWQHLSASSAGCEAIATKCAKLPDRPDGVMLKPGAILLLGMSDRGVAACHDVGDSDSADDSDSDDDPNKSWLGVAPPALRIYYEQPVMPHQGRGAKVLGYVRTNLDAFATAKPRGPSPWPAADSGPEEPSHGFEVVLSNVTLI